MPWDHDAAVAAALAVTDRLEDAMAAPAARTGWTPAPGTTTG